VCVVCGTVWSALGGVSVCCVWDCLEWIWGSECVLCEGWFGVDLGGVSVCWVWECLELNWEE